MGVAYPAFLSRCKCFFGPGIVNRGGGSKQVTALLQRGTPILACPGCVWVFDKTPKDLMPAVQVADHDAFFNFTKGCILTMDDCSF